MEHFVLGSDEACLMASPTGQVKVFGDKLKDKHEKIVNDSRVSITIVRTAATGGATGPTHFLTAGAKVKAGYTPNWLQRHGAAPGSGILATPTAFMTEAARLEIAEERGISAACTRRPTQSPCSSWACRASSARSPPFFLLLRSLPPRQLRLPPRLRLPREAITMKRTKIGRSQEGP
jgi:hypothetical protein